MKTIQFLATFAALAGLLSSSGPLDNIITPSLDDFYPSDDGVWYYEKTTIAFIPFPFLPHFQIDVDIVPLSNGKEMTWVLHVGDGTVVGRIVDTSSERYSTCSVDKGASDPIDISVQAIVTTFCSQIRSMRRISDDKVMVVVLCASGAEGVYFSRHKPNMVESIVPFIM